MGRKSSSFDYRTLAGCILPKDILRFFDVTGIEEKHAGRFGPDGEEEVILRISLDETDSRRTLGHSLKPNGFTEGCDVTDFPLRGHRVILRFRRRRWLDAEGHNVVLSRYQLAAPGTGYSAELAGVLKRYMDTMPVSASSLARHFKIERFNFLRCYKECLSGFTEWEQAPHADEWVLLERNAGLSLSIGETELGGSVRTIVSNAEAKGGKGSLVAVIKGADPDNVESVLRRIPEERRRGVRELVIHSPGMRMAAGKEFPGAAIVSAGRSDGAREDILIERMREFRETIQGIKDLPFFLFRCMGIFG